MWSYIYSWFYPEPPTKQVIYEKDLLNVRLKPVQVQQVPQPQVPQVPQVQQVPLPQVPLPQVPLPQVPQVPLQQVQPTEPIKPKFTLQSLSKEQLANILAVKLKKTNINPKKEYEPRHPVLKELLSKKSISI